MGSLYVCTQMLVPLIEYFIESVSAIFFLSLGILSTSFSFLFSSLIF